MAASGGSPTLTTAPVRLTPRKNLRLLSGIPTSSLELFLIIIQTAEKFRRPYQGDQQILEVEPGIAERHKKLVNHLLVRFAFQATRRIAEDLPHDTFLANRAFGENASQLLGI